MIHRLDTYSRSNRPTNERTNRPGWSKSGSGDAGNVNSLVHGSLASFRSRHREERERVNRKRERERERVSLIDYRPIHGALSSRSPRSPNRDSRFFLFVQSCVLVQRLANPAVRFGRSWCQRGTAAPDYAFPRINPSRRFLRSCPLSLSLFLSANFIPDSTIIYSNVQVELLFPSTFSLFSFLVYIGVSCTCHLFHSDRGTADPLPKIRYATADKEET